MSDATSAERNSNKFYIGCVSPPDARYASPLPIEDTIKFDCESRNRTAPGNAHGYWILTALTWSLTSNATPKKYRERDLFAKLLCPEIIVRRHLSGAPRVRIR
jgi:hypothetical protein